MKLEIDQLKTELTELRARVDLLQRIFRQWQRESGLSTPDFNTFASIKHLEWKLAGLEYENRQAGRQR